MANGDAPSGRCGYTYDVSTLPNIGACTCWRPTWNDEDRCVWHTSNGRKPLTAFEELAPDCPERIDGAIIKTVDLDGCDWFEGCSLIGARIVSVNLREASLEGADLREADMEDVDARNSTFTAANMEDTSLQACDLRHADLSGARFDQAVLSNVRINRATTFGTETVYERALAESTDAEEYDHLSQAAIWSYREIQNIHEENALPFEARHYYLKEKDIRRQVAWHNGHHARALQAEAARWVTGYGMSPWRVIGTAAVIIVLSAILYPTTGGLEETVAPGGLDGRGAEAGNQTTITWTVENPESASQYYLGNVFFRSIYFSVVTFTTLGYGDISPVGNVARGIATVEALLGQLLVALLVFVLSRRIS